MTTLVVQTPGHRLKIVIEESTFIDGVRLLEVSHFDSAISKWGMTSKCRSWAISPQQAPTDLFATHPAL